MKHQLAIVGLLGLFGAPAGAATLYNQPFNVDTASTAQTLSTYGVALSGSITNAIVEGGQLRLFPSGQGQGSLDFGKFTGDITITFDTNTIGAAVAINAGLRVGDNNYIFHPGFSGGAFRIDGTGGHGNVGMGFTPTNSAMNHVTIHIEAATGSSSIKIVDGVDANKVFQETFFDSNYVGGQSVIGFSSGGALGNISVFDNLVVSSVPIPAAAWFFGSAVLGLSLRRSRVS